MDVFVATWHVNPPLILGFLLGGLDIFLHYPSIDYTDSSAIRRTLLHLFHVF